MTRKPLTSGDGPLAYAIALFVGSLIWLVVFAAYVPLTQ